MYNSIKTAPSSCLLGNLGGEYINMWSDCLSQAIELELSVLLRSNRQIPMYYKAQGGLIKT